MQQNLPGLPKPVTYPKHSWGELKRRCIKNICLDVRVDTILSQDQYGDALA